MENIIKEQKTRELEIKKEASQKAMKAIVAMAGIFSLVTVCVVVFCQLFIFTFLLNTL